MDCSLLGSSVHGISQVRILEWVATSFSRGSSRMKDQTHISCKNIEICLHNLGFVNSLLDKTPKAWATKEKINVASSKLKFLCIKGHHQQSEETTQRMQESIHKSCIWKGLAFRRYKELLQLKKANKPTTKWTRTRMDTSRKKIYIWPTNT